MPTPDVTKAIFHLGGPEQCTTLDELLVCPQVLNDDMSDSATRQLDCGAADWVQKAGIAETTLDRNAPIIFHEIVMVARERFEPDARFIVGT